MTRFYTLPAENRSYEEARQFIETVFRLLPHNTPLKKIQIAGTNGKGSTAAMLASILRASGYKTGLNISPSLIYVNERISIDGEYISDDDLLRYQPIIEEAERICGRTFGGFEHITAAAAMFFSEQAVDFAVMETGLGGRFDTVSAVEKLILSSITSIGFDHMHMLGNSLEQIAYEKCGIMRTGVPCVIHPQSNGAYSAIFSSADSLNCKLIDVRTCTVTDNQVNNTRQSMNIHVRGEDYFVDIPLLGEHQHANASNALLCALALRDMGYTNITKATIERGFCETSWHGRLETVKLPIADCPIIIDGAHNVSAMNALAKTLNVLYPNKTHVVLLSIMADKDIPAILNQMLGFASKIVCVKVNSRAIDADKLCELAKAHYFEAYCADSVEEGVRLAARLSNGQGFLAAGSLYLAGKILSLQSSV
jgi:dihydrofolate synthase/folylpolyglutamate synthase